VDEDAIALLHRQSHKGGSWTHTGFHLPGERLEGDEGVGVQQESRR
jgi:hypothetical protein